MLPFKAALLNRNQEKKWLYATSAAVVAITAVAIAFQFYYVLLLPFVIAIVWTAIFKLEWIWYVVVFFTPLSINLEDMDIGGLGIALPTEPLLVGILILFVFKLLLGKSVDPKIFRHPISYILYAYLGWMTITSVSSEMPVVSFKLLATRLWFIAAMYFIAVHLFKDERNIRRFFLLYLFPLLAVIIYTVVRHSMYGFDKNSAHWVMEPIFKDHTSYGAVLAMYLPVVIGLLWRKKMSPLLRFSLYIGLLILTIGLVLSYTRAAWLSIVVAIGVLVALLLKIKFRTLVLALGAIGAFVFMGWDDLQVSLAKNKQDSSDKLEEHVTSMSNVSSDASNLERLNRWNSALGMFKERPILGWGPGTYQFVYAPFQQSKDLTIISTKMGDAGNAHSEYLGPLSEQGILGMLLFVALLVGVSTLAFRLFYTIENRETKILIAIAYLGLITYYVHGVLNNYLDTDKASVPFWGFTAVLVAIDLYHNTAKETEKLSEHQQPL